MNTLPPYLRSIEKKHRICLIVEGLEEYCYFNRILSFPIINRQYDIRLINAKSASNIPIHYQQEYAKNIYELCLVVCDKDRIPDQYNLIMEKIDYILGPGKSKEVVFFTSPCTLQVILSHFADVELTTQAKKEARPIVKELTGIDHYDAHTEQLEAICKQIFNRSYPEMKARISKLSSNPDDLPSTNLVKLFNFLESADNQWISEINERLMADGEE